MRRAPSRRSTPYRVFDPAGVPVYFHGSTVAILALLVCSAPRLGLPRITLAIAYLLILLVHEAGHAELARRLGYRASRIEGGRAGEGAEERVP